MSGERISLPSVGDVIVCEAFVNGWRRLVQPDVAEGGPIWASDITDLQKRRPGMALQERRDPSRGAARFVVEECVDAIIEKLLALGYILPHGHISA